MHPSDSAPVAESPEPDVGAAERRDLWREATTMALYVSVVLLATLAALPAGQDDAGEPIDGPVGTELIAILWGTTIGLSLAHSFAFQVARQGMGGRLRGQDFKRAIAEVAGAAFAAAVASVPVLVFGQKTEQQVVLIDLALIIGMVSYLVERASGRTRTASVIFGVITLVVGLVAATTKNLLSGH